MIKPDSDEQESFGPGHVIVGPSVPLPLLSPPIANRLVVGSDAWFESLPRAEDFVPQTNEVQQKRDFETYLNSLPGPDPATELRLTNRVRALEKQAEDKRQADRICGAVEDRKATHGGSFEENWNAVRREQPDLFGVPVKHLTNRAARTASVSDESERARTCDAVVKLRMLANRCSFSNAWDFLARQRPELFSLGTTPFLNRQTSDILDWIDDDSKQMVASFEPKVKSVVQRMNSKYGSRTVSSALGDSVRRLTSQLKDVMDQESLSFDDAWSKLRHDDPIGFATRIIQAGRQIEDFEPVDLTGAKQYGPPMTGPNGWAAQA